MLILYTTQFLPQLGRLLQQPYIASIGVSPQASAEWCMIRYDVELFLLDILEVLLCFSEKL